MPLYLIYVLIVDRLAEDSYSSDIPMGPVVQVPDTGSFTRRSAQNMGAHRSVTTLLHVSSA